jgi:hypothetical protein
MRARGGFIGANVTPASAAVNSAASGVWTVREAESLKRAGTWPRAIPVLPTISGLQLWYDAADSTTLYDATTGGSPVAANGAVARWEDKSGNARHMTQATAGSRPTYQTSQLNSLPVVTFDGSNDILTTSSAGSSGSDDFSVFFVAKTITGEESEDIPLWLGNPAVTRAARGIYRPSGGTTLGFATWANDLTSSAYSLDIGGSYHIFAARLSGSNVQLRRNGLATSYTLPQSALSVSGNIFQLGAIDFGNFQYAANVAFAEVLVFYSYASDQVTGVVEGYLSSKWAINLG